MTGALPVAMKSSVCSSSSAPGRRVRQASTSSFHAAASSAIAFDRRRLQELRDQLRIRRGVEKARDQPAARKFARRAASSASIIS